MPRPQQSARFQDQFVASNEVQAVALPTPLEGRFLVPAGTLYLVADESRDVYFEKVTICMSPSPLNRTTSIPNLTSATDRF